MHKFRNDPIITTRPMIGQMVLMLLFYVLCFMHAVRYERARVVVVSVWISPKL